MEPDVCSSRGCREPAVWALRWNNPRLHPPERRKTWLACDEHRASLGDFLTSRAFLREVETHEPVDLHERLRLEPLDLDRARELTSWAYPAPDERYGLTGADPAALADPAAGYHAVLDGDDLVAYRCFGPEGRVPGFAYDDPDPDLAHGPVLDTGGGLRPDLVGRGWGARVIDVGLAHGRRLHDPAAWRVSVAADNARALRVVESLGFTRAAQFAASTDGRDYVVLVRRER